VDFTSVPGDFHVNPAAAAFGGVTGQLLLMLNLNHTNEQDKPEKFS